jgi:S-formylglutathione hydrolase FrmB
VQCTGYLSDRSEWAQYDATELMSNISPEAKNAFDDILIDVGTADNFLSGGQLLPEVRHRTVCEWCCANCGVVSLCIVSARGNICRS